MREARRHRGAVPVLAVLGLSGIAAGSGVVVSASTTVPGRRWRGITDAPFGTVANPDSPSDGMDVELYTLDERRRDGGQDHDLRRRSSSRSRSPTAMARWPT